MSSQNELRTAITAQIVDALTAGGLPPWRQPWKADRNCGTPTNIVSKRNYTGINPLLLAIASQKHGFQSRWWGTFNQWKQLGGQVKARPSHVPPGKWGAQIVFCRPITKTEKKPDGEEQDKTFFFLRTFTVFCLDQVEGSSLDHLRAGNAPLTAADTHCRHEEAERVIAATFADIRHGGDRAFYRFKEDFIQMPERERFVSAEAYYETLGHEMTHWTEHPSRLNWNRAEKENTYALGELAAELGACYFMAELGLPLADTWKNSAAYLQSWLKAMNQDPGSSSRRRLRPAGRRTTSCPTPASKPRSKSKCDTGCRAVPGTHRGRTTRTVTAPLRLRRQTASTRRMTDRPVVAARVLLQ